MSEGWTITPDNPVTSGSTVNATYSGAKHVKSVKYVRTSYALSEVTTNQIGWFIATNGIVYPSVAKAKEAGTSVCAIVAYVGSETGETGYTHGLAIAMKDANNGNTCQWKTSSGTADNPQMNNDIATQFGYKESGSSLSSGRGSDTWPAFNATLNNTISISTEESSYISASVPTVGTTSGWFLPSIWQWNQIVKGVIKTSTDLTSAENPALKADAFNASIPTAYRILPEFYWSSSERNINGAWDYNAYAGKAGEDWKNNSEYKYVRAVFAF